MNEITYLGLTLDDTELLANNVRLWDAECKMSYRDVGIVACNSYDAGTHGDIMLQYRHDGWYKRIDSKTFERVSK